MDAVVETSLPTAVRPAPWKLHYFQHVGRILDVNCIGGRGRVVRERCQTLSQAFDIVAAWEENQGPRACGHPHQVEDAAAQLRGRQCRGLGPECRVDTLIQGSFRGRHVEGGLSLISHVRNWRAVPQRRAAHLQRINEVGPHHDVRRLPALF